MVKYHRLVETSSYCQIQDALTNSLQHALWEVRDFFLWAKHHPSCICILQGNWGREQESRTLKWMSKVGYRSPLTEMLWFSWLLATSFCNSQSFCTWGSGKSFCELRPAQLGVSGEFECWFLTTKKHSSAQGHKTKLVATITLSTVNLNEENTWKEPQPSGRPLTLCPVLKKERKCNPLPIKHIASLQN